MDFLCDGYRKNRINSVGYLIIFLWKKNIILLSGINLSVNSRSIIYFFKVNLVVKAKSTFLLDAM